MKKFNWTKELKELLDEGESILCKEWYGEIRLHGMLFNSSLFGRIMGIHSLAKDRPHKDWSNDDKKKYEKLIHPISNSLYLDLHYIPKINCWRIRVNGQEILISRKIIGWMSNEPIFTKEIVNNVDEQLTIEIYEREFVNDNDETLSGPRLAFCLVYSNGLGIIKNKKDESLTIVQYPLPDRDNFKQQNEKIEKLGWKIEEEAISDTSGQDYFGEYHLIEHPAVYENGGVSIKRWI